MKTKSKIWVFPIVLVMYEFAVNLSNDLYLPGLPDLSKDLAVSPSIAQLTVSFWLVGWAMAQFILGPLSDSKGRRFVLLGGGLIFLLSTLACSNATQIEWVLLSRFFQGTGVCSLIVAGYVTIHELFDDYHVIRVLTWMGSVAVIAPLSGPLLGSWVLTWSDWRMIFKILFMLGLLPYIGLWFLMPETNPVTNRSTFQLRSVSTIYARILSNRRFMCGALSYGLLYAGEMIWLTASSFLIIDSMRLSRNTYGIVQIPVCLSYVIGAWIVRKGIDRLGSEKLVQIGLIISCLSTVGFLASGYLFSPTVLSLMVPMSCYSFSVGLCQAPLNRITLSSTQEGKGSACAIFYLCMGATGAMGSLLVSSVGSSSVIFISSLMLGVSVLGLIVNYCRMHLLLTLRRDLTT